MTTSTRTDKSRNTNIMNKHCSQWSPNDHILRSPISTVCGQYCVAFLMFRCRNISMHAFARLFTSDLIANDCRVFDWIRALKKNDEKHLCLLVMLTTSTPVIDSHFMSSSQTYRRQFWRKKPSSYSSTDNRERSTNSLVTAAC